MGSVGWSEMVIIAVVALVIFGPRKLPELGRSLGKGLAEFKRATNDLKRTWEEEVEAETKDLSKTIESEKREFDETIDSFKTPAGTVERG